MIIRNIGKKEQKYKDHLPSFEDNLLNKYDIDKINQKEHHWEVQFKDNSFYSGEIKNLEKWGLGTLTLEDETKYQGNFENLTLNGPGQITYPNGSLEKGTFVNNSLHGFGEVKNNNTKKGIFNQSSFTGEVVYQSSNVLNGRFINDTIVKGKFTINNWDIKVWSEEEVLYWIKYFISDKIYSKVCSQFGENCINGKILDSLKEEDFKDLKVNKFVLRFILIERDAIDKE